VGSLPLRLDGSVQPAAWVSGSEAGKPQDTMLQLCVHSSMVSWALLALFGQLVSPRQSMVWQVPAVAAVRGHSTPWEVTVEGLEVYERPDEAAYIIGALGQGEGISVRRMVAGGWLAIDPPPGTLCWIEHSAIDTTGVTVKESVPIGDAGRSKRNASRRASVAVDRAVIRFGHADARLPGPPCGELSRGTIVELFDLAPLEVGRGSSMRAWMAIVPPAELACYIRGDGARTQGPQATAPVLDSQSGYVAARYATTNPNDTRLDNFPANYAAQIKDVDELHRSMRLSQPVAQWRTETVRSRYQSILKSAGNEPAVEEAIRWRLTSITRDEQAVQAARTIESVLAESHRRDAEVAAVKRRVAAVGQSHSRGYSAVGYIQPSSEQVSGQKLFLLIGKDGSTVAYLDIPPGLEIEPLLARRVGVRGDPHFNEDLGSRLITVRDVETMDSRR
jgi:hypothetical protein